MNRAYFESAKVLSVLLVLIGAAMIVSTLARGGGPLALGLLLGVAFVALGIARLRLARALGPR
jgi:hypothetical protein